MAELEADIMRRIMIRASELGARVFRNNTGQAWQGEVTQLANGDVLIRNPRPVRMGLCKGSSDLIGWNKAGRFVALEVKRPGGRPTPDQGLFISVVRGSGGIGSVVHSDSVLPDLLD